MEAGCRHMYHAHEPKSRVALLIPISRCMYVRTYRTKVRRHTASCPFVICFLKQLRRPIRRSSRWLPERPACKEQNTAWADVAQVCILGTWKLSPSLKDEKWGQDLVFPHLDPGDSDLDGQPPASIMEWKEYDNANRIEYRGQKACVSPAALTIVSGDSCSILHIAAQHASRSQLRPFRHNLSSSELSMSNAQFYPRMVIPPSFFQAFCHADLS